MGRLNSESKIARLKAGSIELLNQQSIVTAASASFSNIIASIPIVGFEFPTTQHMGSIEPSYNFEIQFINQDNPEELPDSGKELNRIFSQLQRNARDYRIAPDSHAFALDSFLTRLMGSFSIDDVRIGYDSDDPLFKRKRNSLNFIPTEIVPRCVVNRTAISNVEGSPGRYLMNLEVNETNPFFVEEIKVYKSQPSAQVRDTTSFTEVLHRLYDVAGNITEAGRTALLLSMIDSKGFGTVTGDLSTDSFKINTFNSEGESIVVSHEGYAAGAPESIDRVFLGMNLFKSERSGSSLDMRGRVVDLFTGQKNRNLVPTNVANLFHDHNDTGEFDPKVSDMVKGLSLFEDAPDFSVYQDGEIRYKGKSVPIEKIDEFYENNPSYSKNPVRATGEGSGIRQLPSFISALNNIMQRMRATIVEEEAGGLSSDLVSETLYDSKEWVKSDTRRIRYSGGRFVGSMDLDRLYRTPACWRNHIYWMFKFLHDKVIDDDESDPIDGALAWTKKNVIDYFESIDFDRLYLTISHGDTDPGRPKVGIDINIRLFHTLRFADPRGGDVNVPAFRDNRSGFNFISDRIDDGINQFGSPMVDLDFGTSDQALFNGILGIEPTSDSSEALEGYSSALKYNRSFDWFGIFKIFRAFEGGPTGEVEEIDFEQFMSLPIETLESESFYLGVKNDLEATIYFSITSDDGSDWIGDVGAGLKHFTEDEHHGIITRSGKVGDTKVYYAKRQVYIEEAATVFIGEAISDSFINPDMIVELNQLTAFENLHEIVSDMEYASLTFGDIFNTPLEDMENHEDEKFGFGGDSVHYRIRDMANSIAMFNEEVFTNYFTIIHKFSEQIPSDEEELLYSEEKDDPVSKSVNTIQEVQTYKYLYPTDWSFINYAVAAHDPLTHNAGDLVLGTNNSFVGGFYTMMDGGGGLFENMYENTIWGIGETFNTSWAHEHLSNTEYTWDSTSGEYIFKFNHTTDWLGDASGFYGGSGAELERKGEIFKERRRELWYSYLESLNGNGLETAVGDIAINNTFPLLKAYAGMRFTEDAIEEQPGGQKFMMFSGLERKFSLFSEWLIEPKLINDMPLDMIYGQATDDAVFEYFLSGGLASGITTFENASGMLSPVATAAGGLQAGALGFDAYALLRGAGPTGIQSFGPLGAARAYTGATGMAGAAFNLLKTGGYYTGIATVVSAIPNTVGHGLGATSYLTGLSEPIEGQDGNLGGVSPFTKESLVKMQVTNAIIDSNNSATSRFFTGDYSGGRYGSTTIGGSVSFIDDPKLTSPLLGIELKAAHVFQSEEEYLKHHRILDKGDLTRGIRDLLSDNGLEYDQALFDSELDRRRKVMAYLKAQTSVKYEGWDSLKDPRIDRTKLKVARLASYTSEENEKAKLAVFASELKALVKEVLKNREVCAALEIPFEDAVYVPSSEKYAGSNCYPDINLPAHPFYDRSNLEINPMFYMWDIYSDGGAKLDKYFLDEVDKNARVYLEGAYNHLKQMQYGNIEVSDMPDSNPSNPDGTSSANPFNKKLKIDPEASDMVYNYTHVDTDASGNFKLRFTRLGECTTPFFTGSDKPPILTDEQKEALITDLQNTQDPSVKDYTFGKGSGLNSYHLKNRAAIVKQRMAIYNYLRFATLDANKTIKKPALAYLTDFTSGTTQAAVDSLYTLGGMPLGIDTSMVYDGTTGVASPTDAFNGFTEIPSSTEISEYKPLVRPSNSSLDGKYWIEDPAFHSNYISLQEKVTSIENMFGNGAGYTGELIKDTTENTEKIEELLNDIKLRGLGDQSNYNQAFSLSGLASLARASCADIFSERKKMSQSMPTFKLFFIEEDEMESRFLNLDDFHAFNGVKSFTVNRDRESPADTAVISLQNVAGTLDGTRRGAILDVDYFDKKRQARAVRLQNKKRMAESPTGEDLSEPSNIKNEDSQPFSAIVMRPGINIQLRAGYSNNPDYLEVLISGRVTDVSWGAGGDTCEIVVQSFGTELVQQIKGMTGDEVKYFATHQILGDMMLSPELKHFGRWETDRVFQYGESSDARLDFFQYKNKTAPSSTAKIQEYGQWIFDNGFYIAISAMAIATLKFNVLGKGFTRAGILAEGAQGFTLASLKSSGQWLKALGSAGSAFINTRYTSILSWARLSGKQGISPINNLIAPSFRTASGQQTLLNALNAVAQTGTRAGKLLSHLSNDLVSSLKSLISNVNGLRNLLSAGDVSSDIIKARLSLMLQMTKGPAYTGMPVMNNLRRSAEVLIKSLDDGVALTKAQTAEVARIANGMEHVSLAIASAPSGARAVFLEGYRAAGYWNVTKLIGGDLLAAAFSPGAIFFKTALLYLGFDHIAGGLTANLKEYREAMERWFTKELVYFKMNPVDDNLYPPNPAFYMHFIKDYEKDFFSQIKFTFMYAFTGSADDNYNDVLKKWKTTNPLLNLKRVAVADCIYYLNSNTIWDIFHEMSLRHPGYIYGPVPYGNDFRYTMFFGVPSQRYWSKGVSPGFIRRMNTVRDHLTVKIPTLKQVKKLHGDMYSNSAYSNLDFDPNSEQNKNRYEKFKQAEVSRRKASVTAIARTITMENERKVGSYVIPHIYQIVGEYYTEGDYNKTPKSEYVSRDSISAPSVSYPGSLFEKEDKAVRTYARKANAYASPGSSADYQSSTLNMYFWDQTWSGADGLKPQRDELIRTLTDMTPMGKFEAAIDYFTAKKISITEYLKWFEEVGKAQFVSMQDDLRKSTEELLKKYPEQDRDLVNEVFSSKHFYFSNKNSAAIYLGGLNGLSMDEFDSIISSQDGSLSSAAEGDISVVDAETFLKNNHIVSFRSRLLAEYLNGLEQRFVPFRRYHLIRSKNNLVKNNLVCSLKNCVNSVNVAYKSGDEEKSLFMKASSGLNDEALITENMMEYTQNVRSHAMALRYGQGRLLYGMREMYGGEIMVLGNPRMKPWDVCFLFDQYNEMSGPIEIKSVTHMFSFETGFLTEIVPNAVVVANETSSWPVIEALKVYVAAAMDRENGISQINDVSEDPMEAKTDIGGWTQSSQPSKEDSVAYQKAISDMAKQTSAELGRVPYGSFGQRMGWKGAVPDVDVKFDGHNLSFETSDFMIKRYSELVKQKLITYENYGDPKITQGENGEIIRTYSKRATIDTKEVLKEVFGEKQGSPFAEDFNLDDMNNGLLDSVDTLFSLGAGYYLGRDAMNPFSGTGGDVIAKGTGLSAMGIAMLGLLGKSKKASFLTGLAGLGVYGSSVANQTITNYDTVTDRFSASYLLGAPVIFSKLMESDSVTVVPLVKNGAPLLAGVSSRSPISFWKTILGDLVTAADDTFRGIFDNYKETEALGTAFWDQVVYRNPERQNDKGIKYLKESGGINQYIKKGF